MSHPKEVIMAIRVKIWLYLRESYYLMIALNFWIKFAPVANGLPKYLEKIIGVIRYIGFCLIKLPRIFQVNVFE